MSDFFYCLIFCCFACFLIFAGIDREVARRDWVENGVAENCLFAFNCDHFNNMNQ